MNVPETMNEVLDMSDDEGTDSLLQLYSCVNLFYLKQLPSRTT